MIRPAAIRLYYNVRPFLPRSLLVLLRRGIVHWSLRYHRNCWPIDSRAGHAPQGWPGWPEGKKFAFVPTHDVETAKGLTTIRQLVELEESLGFHSSFNFVPELYRVPPELRQFLTEKGFEVGVHGLIHDGRLYFSKKIFDSRAVRINHYLKDWRSVGFRSPSMHHNLEWIHALDIEYDASTFDTDPFEPQNDGVRTIFPFWVPDSAATGGYVELPYTLPQDSTLFIFLQRTNIDIWKHKLDWIVEHGGMALFIVHPDYVCFENRKVHLDEYPVRYYEEFLKHVQSRYAGQYWHALPREVARYWKQTMVKP